MPIPAQNAAWPPADWAPAFQQYEINDAWYSGDVEALAGLYAGGANGYARGDSDDYHYNKGNGNVRTLRRLVSSILSWFSGSAKPAGENRTRLHSPLAGNLATLSADVLMSEPPTVRLVRDGKALTGERDPETGERAADPAQARLDQLVNTPAAHRAMIQAAEYVAGLSAVALTVNWDTANTDRPWIGFVACDAVVPEWEGERLVGVNLWTTYPVTNMVGAVTGIYYHVERHEVGRVVHALYKGTEQTIGEIVDPAELPALAHLVSIPGSQRGAGDGDPKGLAVVLPTGIDKLTAAFWRNLPTRQFRKNGTLSRVGRSDFEGVEHYLDQVDMVWSSWMRDIKIARARLVVPETWLETSVPGAGPAFDDDAEVITALNYVQTGDKEQISAHQFEIRAQQHADSILGLTKEVLQHAGYSLASYGEFGDVQKTATEVNDRTTATERTRDKKGLYFVDAFAPLVEALLAIDRQHYPDGLGLPDGAEITIEFPDQSQVDPEKEARVLQTLRGAMAASTETLVRMQHPEWDNDEVSAEVGRINQENALGGEVDPALEGRTLPDGTRVNQTGENGDEPEPDPADEPEDERRPRAVA